MLLAVMLISFKDVIAQQCGYDFYYLFVVNVHTKNSTERVPNLKMYLVDENEKPITIEVLYNENAKKKDGDEYGKWKYKTDTLFFWDNAKAPKNAGTKPLLRQKFYRVGDNYLVAFHLKGNEVKDPEKYPLYKLKIERKNDEMAGLHFPTQTFHLPLGKAVNICHNHLYDDFNYQQPVTSYDNQPFKPIDIVLNEATEQFGFVVEEPKNELQYTVRFNYQTIPAVSENEEYILNTAKIYNVQTGKLHQEIYIPSKSKSILKVSKNIVEFIDFYDRGIAEAKDFSVQMETWRDLDNKVAREKNNFYIFNTQTKKYELDTALSNYNDVFYYAPLKKMRRYEYLTTDVSKTIFTYQLDNKKWVLIDKNETLFKPNTSTRELSIKECIYVKENAHTLPIKAVIGTNAKVTVTDTLWIYNTSNKTIEISKVQSSNRDFFSINQTLLPNSKNPLIFNGTLISNSFDFTINNFNCMLTFSDGYMLGLGVSIPTVSNNATVYYNTDSTINYAIANPYKSRFATAIFSFPDGTLRTKGEVQDKDTSLKVGKWQYYKQGTWGFDEIVYSKQISLAAFDRENGSQHTNFNIKVLENGKWKQPVLDDRNGQKSFYITATTDSIVAFNDTTSYGFALQYNTIPANIAMQFFLLKPNERTIKIGYYRMPFSVLKNQYTIIPDYSKFKNKNKTTYQITDSILTALQKKHPKISTVYVSKHQRGINLSSLNFDEQYKVIMQLTNDTCIRFVCNLFTQMNKNRITFCNNEVYVELNTTNIEDFKKQALALHFANIRTDMGSNRYWLTHAGKLIDESFFEAFDKLTKNPFVLSAHFNTYHEPELDNKIPF